MVDLSSISSAYHASALGRTSAEKTDDGKKMSIRYKAGDKVRPLFPPIFTVRPLTPQPGLMEADKNL